MAKNLIIKVTLQDVEKPSVWRKLLFPADGSFEQLNHAIQYCMEWDDILTYNFEVYKDGKEAHISWLSDDPDYNSDHFWHGETLDARNVAVGEYLKEAGDTIRYIFGDDDWFHKIELESIIDNDCHSPEIAYIDAEGACPSPLAVRNANDYRRIKRMFGIPCERTIFDIDSKYEDPDQEYITTRRRLMELRPDDKLDPTRFSMREISKRLEIWITTSKLKLLHSDEEIIFSPHSSPWWRGTWSNPTN